VMRQIAGALAGLLLTGCSLGIGQPAARQLLAYAGNSGDSAKYIARQKLRGRIALNGMPQLAVIESRTQLTEAIEQVYSDGRRRIRLLYGLDSLEVNGARAGIEEKWRNIEIELMRIPAGRSEIVSIPKGAEEALGWMMQSLEMFFPVLPDFPVAAGESWKESTRTQMGDVIVATESSGELLGFESVEGERCATIGLELSVRTEGKTKGTSLGRFDLSLKGKVHFSVAGGYVMRARHRGRMDIGVQRGDLPIDAKLMFVMQFDRMPAR
jgi:hypothetical protein